MRGLAYALEQAAIVLRMHNTADAVQIITERVHKLTEDIERTHEGENKYIEQQIAGYRQVLNAIHLFSLGVTLPKLPTPKAS